MTKALPIIEVYEKPFEDPIVVKAGPIARVVTGQTFVFHTSLLAAIDHEAVPSEATGYAVEFMEEHAEAPSDRTVPDVAIEILKDILRDAVEYAFDGTEVVNLTTFSTRFGMDICKHPKFMALDEVTAARVMTGIFSILCFIRDDCPFRIHSKDGAEIDYPQ